MKTMLNFCVLVVMVAAFSLAVVGCKAHHADHPHGDHPKADHPHGDHPKADHPDGDHPK